MRYVRWSWSSIAAAVIAAGCGAKTELEAEPRTVRLMDAAGNQTCVVDNRDDVWCWGVVGGEPEFMARPVVRIANVTAIEQLAVSGGSLCVRTSDGVVRCSGNNELGSLGVEGPDRRAFSPVEGIGRSVEIVELSGRYCALDDGGTVRCWGPMSVLGDGGIETLRFAPTVIALPEPVTHVHRGERFCAETASGAVYCESPYVGRTRAVLREIQRFEVTGTGERLSMGRSLCVRVGESIRCEQDSSAAGRAEFHGVPEAMTSVFFLNEGGVCGLLRGRLLCQGGARDGRRPAMRPSSIATWDEAELPSLREVHAGFASMCAVDTEGRPLCWGDDSFAQLGQGLPRYTHQPTRVALSDAPRSIGMLANVGEPSADVGYARRWVRRTNLRSTIDEERSALARSEWSPFASRFASEQTMLESATPFEEVLFELGVGCARSSSEPTRCRATWIVDGRPFGQDAGQTLSIVLGGDGACRIRADHRVECTSQLTDPSATSTVELPFDDVVSIARGQQRLCALSRDRVVRCVGEAPLGDGTTSASNTPTIIATDVDAIEQHEGITCIVDREQRRACWGRFARWMFEAGSSEAVLRPRRLEFGQRVRSLAISNAGEVMCAITDERAVFCKGVNYMSQCGQPASRRIVDWSRVEGITDADALFIGYGQTCARHASGALSCWGAHSGRFGGFGHVPHSDRAVYVELVER